MRAKLKKVFLLIILISLSIMVSVIPAIINTYYKSDYGLSANYIYKSDKMLEKDFYKSTKFEYRVIENILYPILDTVMDVDSEIDEYIKSNTEIEYEEYLDNENVYQSKEIIKAPTKEEARKALNENIEYSKSVLKNDYLGVQFIVVNKDNDKIYSNTKYDTVKAFKQNIKGYVDIELVKNTHTNGYYKKHINGKTYTNNNIETINILNSISDNNNIEVYMSFPKNIDENSVIYRYMDEYNTSIKYIEIYLMIGSISLVLFLLAIIFYKLTKGQAINKDGMFSKIITRVPLEFWLMIILVICMFTNGYLTSHYYGLSYWKEKICGFIGVFIIITTLYIQVYKLKNYDKKLDYFKNSAIYILYNVIRNNTKQLMNYSRKIPMIKQIIFMAILFTGGSLLIGAVMAILLGFGLIGVGIPVLIAMSIFTWYIVKKLMYVSDIIDGTQKIKDGQLDYKIELKGYSSFTQLAENINNIGEGLENSIDTQLRSERMKSELITNVSHDLKTPLTSIINYIELIKKEKNIEPEYLNDYISVLDSKSKRLKVLIEDLFEASKASSGNLELNMEKIDIVQLLKQSIGELEEKLNNSNLDLKISEPGEKVYIYADGRRMYRVFENLLSNIAKYSLPNTRVYIDVVEDDENIKLTMKNISAYELNFDPSEITERFKRGDESRNTEGSGLGLAIAKDLVRLQNGSFDIDIDGDLFKATIQFKKSNK
ncbi:MAG: sensor histidine kinase [Peptostreptococcaceae bacterium]